MSYEQLHVNNFYSAFSKPMSWSSRRSSDCFSLLLASTEAVVTLGPRIAILGPLPNLLVNGLKRLLAPCHDTPSKSSMGVGIEVGWAASVAFPDTGALLDGNSLDYSLIVYMLVPLVFVKYLSVSCPC